MRAVVAPVAGGPEVLELRTVPDPRPGPGEVLVRVAATSVNRADLNERAGRSARRPGGILGLEAAGEVAELGEDVTGWSAGDRVCTLLDSGGYAEYVTAPADSLLPVPESLDLVTAGAFAEVFLTGFDALDLRARTRPGETVLVHGGAGGLGTACLQLARAMGCHVLTTVRRAGQEQACRELGAEVVRTDQAAEAGPWDEQVRDLTGGAGPDVIVDVLGAAAWPQNLSLLGDDGRMVVLGTMTGSCVELDLQDLMRPRRSLLAATMRGRPPVHKAALVHAFRERWGEAVAAGRLRPVVAQVLPLERAADAHRLLEQGGHVGNVVIEMRPTRAA